MTTDQTRRDFLRTSVLAVTWPWLSRLGLTLSPHSPADHPEAVPAGLGRAVTTGLVVREKPLAAAARVRALARDEVIPVIAEVEGEAVMAHNSVWFQTSDGYVFSSYVQPVENSPQTPLVALPEGSRGLLAEVSIPYVDSLAEPRPDARRSYRLYYSTVYRITRIQRDEAAVSWYGLDDAGAFGVARWVPAEAMRILTAEALSPLSPGAEKYIHVSLTKQLLEAYEGGAKVFETRTSSGIVMEIDGEVMDFRTTTGTHRVLWKRPTSHMRGGTEGKPDYYDLPGVPFCTYFTRTAEAVHGTYWHNDYGRPRSHGCLNATPQAARWVYRWTEPAVPYDEEHATAAQGEGTLIEVEA